MKRLVRPLLFPLMAAFELLLLVAGWICAVLHPATASRIIWLAKRLPDPKWYWPNAPAVAHQPPQAGGSAEKEN